MTQRDDQFSTKPEPVNCGEPIGSVQFVDAAGALAAAYPESRASREHTARVDHGVNYASFLVTPRAVVADEGYAQMMHGVDAYLRGCARLAQLFAMMRDEGERPAQGGDSGVRVLRAYLEKTLMPHMHPRIRDLAASRQVEGLIGALFGSDTWISPTGKSSSCEVNVGPATGGIFEVAEVARRLSGPSPISPEAIEAKVFQAFSAYYVKTCEARGITPIPLCSRQIVIVENDGYYSASFILSQAFKRIAGIDVPVLPREAIKHDAASDRLYYTDGTGHSVFIDQMVCDFYLEADPKGPIVDALIRGRVVGTSAPVVDIILGAKWTLGLLMHAADVPQCARQLGLDEADCAALKAAFPRSRQHSAALFNELGVNGFNLTSVLADGRHPLTQMFVKFSGGGTYGGYDVYDLSVEAHSREWLKNFRSRILHTLAVSTVDRNRFAHDSPEGLMSRAFSPNTAQAFLATYPAAEKGPRWGEGRARILFDLAYGIVCTKQPVEELRARVSSALPGNNRFEPAAQAALEDLFVLRQEIDAGAPIEGKRFKQSLDRFAKGLLVTLGRSAGGGEDQECSARLLMQIGLQCYMPYIYQERIQVANALEVRVSGVLTEHGPAYFAGMGRGHYEGKRTATVVTPQGFAAPFANRHDDPASKTLELELDRQPDELLMIKPAEHVAVTAVLMSGTGRHARALAGYADVVRAVDLSALYLNTSKARADGAGIGNIQHIEGDVLAYLKAQASGSHDSLGVYGNSIIYLPPAVAEELLRECARVLKRGGAFFTDFVDLEKYAPRLAGSPVSSMVLRDSETGHWYERLVARRIEPFADSPAYVALKNLGIYIDRHRHIETTHDDGYLYLPRRSEFAALLKAVGFSEVTTQEFAADYPLLNMMRNRIAVRATR